MNKIVLIGGGGHCISCLDIIKEKTEYTIVGIIDKFTSSIKNFDYLGNHESLEKYFDDYSFFITYGQTTNHKRRKNLFDYLISNKQNLPTFISNNAYLASNVSVDIGTIIFHLCILNSGSRIGKNCIINNMALIEHGSSIGDNCHISTGVRINGDVKIGNNCFIGSGTIINHKIVIGDNCFINSGKVIDKNLPDKTFIR